jgi:hypothetical protein
MHRENAVRSILALVLPEPQVFLRGHTCAATSVPEMADWSTALGVASVVLTVTVVYIGDLRYYRIHILQLVHPDKFTWQVVYDESFSDLRLLCLQVDWWMRRCTKGTV